MGSPSNDVNAIGYVFQRRAFAYLIGITPSPSALRAQRAAASTAAGGQAANAAPYRIVCADRWDHRTATTSVAA